MCLAVCAMVRSKSIHLPLSGVATRSAPLELAFLGRVVSLIITGEVAGFGAPEQHKRYKFFNTKGNKRRLPSLHVLV